jgi:hypothetical protein
MKQTLTTGVTGFTKMMAVTGKHVRKAATKSQGGYVESVGELSVEGRSQK